MTETQPPDPINLEMSAWASDTLSELQPGSQFPSAMFALTSILITIIAFIQKIILTFVTNISYDHSQSRLSLIVFILGYITIYLGLIILSLIFCYLSNNDKDIVVFLVSNGYVGLVLINTVFMLLEKWDFTQIVFMIGAGVFTILLWLTILLTAIGLILNIIEKVINFFKTVGSYLDRLYAKLRAELGKLARFPVYSVENV